MNQHTELHIAVITNTPSQGALKDFQKKLLEIHRREGKICSTFTAKKRANN